MDSCSPAEILCTQPLLAILKLKSLGIKNISSFKWIEPPYLRDLQEAHETLIWLNALNDQGELTDLGKEMVHLGIDPRLTAMLYKAKELKCLSEVLIIAGMLTVSQNIWWRGKGEDGKRAETEAREKFSDKHGDHITFLIIYQKWNNFSESQRKAQYDWCSKNYVNAKSLQIANNFIQEISKQVNHTMTIVKDLNQDLIDRILQCITAGYFQNLAVSNGPLQAGYQVIPAFQSASKKLLTARVLLVSALALALKNQMPQYILYNELVNLNGINYITTLSTVDPDWLRSVSKQWCESADINKIHLITYESFTFTDVTPALMRAVVGKRNCKLNMINETIQGVVEVDYTNVKLIIWCQKSNLDNAKEIMKKMLEKEKQKLSDEQEEIQIIGRTRIVMGNGGETKMVLVENEFIRIILTMLPATITEERINELCEPYGRSKFMIRLFLVLCIGIYFSS
jgi:HrpA-like RNA helicase